MPRGSSYVRMWSTGIRREWLGPRFILYAMNLGGEFRRMESFVRDNAFDVLFVPEGEWPDLREEYLQYEKEVDLTWRPSGNRWDENSLMHIEAFVA